MGNGIGARDGRFATLLDEHGNPPCHPPDDCAVCVLFTIPREGESRADWLARITDEGRTALEEAS